MNTLHTVLFATSLFFAPEANTAVSGPAFLAANEPVPTERVVDSSRDALTETIREGLHVPPSAMEPNQEVIVRIKFQVDAQNQINLLDVNGNNNTVVEHVREHLQGKSIHEASVLQDVTFSTTLRFVP